MGFLMGVVAADELDRATRRRLPAVAAEYGLDMAREWAGPGVALAYVPRAVTPEDAYDCAPEPFAGGRYVGAFNGRLDNRDDVLGALGMQVPEAARMSDGTVALTAMARWGEDALVRLIGDFTVAWWDGRERRLVLGCDSDGGNTFYVYAGARRLYFATRPGAFHAFPEIPRALDRQTMAHLLLRRTPPAEATPYRDILRLPAAGRLVWTEMGHRVDRYWRPQWTQRIRYQSDGDYVEAGREMLDRVVTPRLRMTGPVVCQLSAGLDSPAVAATAARLLVPGTLHTITTSPAPAATLPAEPAGMVYDEWPLARRVAEMHPNIVAHQTPAGGITPEEADPVRMFQAFGWPVRNPINFGSFRAGYEKARELGARALLSGLAGNVTLTWQTTALLADLATAGNVKGLVSQVWAMRREGASVREAIRWELAEPLAPGWVRAAWRALPLRRRVEEWRRYSGITPEFAAEIDLAGILAESWTAADAPGRDARARQVFLEAHLSRRQVMAAHPYVSGCEMRDPLGDRRMQEFCLAIPAEQWQLGGVSRSFARRVLTDRLPKEIYNNRRRGYQCADWYARMDAMREGMREELSRMERSAAVLQMLDVPRLRRLLDNWPENPDAAFGRGLLSVLGPGIHFGSFIRWVERGA